MVKMRNGRKKNSRETGLEKMVRSLKSIES